MSSMRKKMFSKLLLLTGFFVLGVSFLFFGCATAPKTLNPAITSPQVIVNPESISLGVAALTGTKIVFEGSGFKPEDDVFISLIGANDIDVPIAYAKVGSDGKFTAPIEDLTKITGILRATVTSKYAKDGKQAVIPVITQPQIPAGAYTAKATSMLSDLTAETNFTLKKPY